MLVCASSRSRAVRVVPSMSIPSCVLTARPSIPIVRGTSPRTNVEKWDNHLGQVFNRGFWDGYYLGQRLGEWTSSYGSSATKQKVYVAKTTKYFGKVGVGEFAVESGELKVGDEIIITGPTTGLVRFVVEEIRVDMEPVEKAVKGQLCSIAVPEKVRPGDRLYLFTDRKVMQ